MSNATYVFNSAIKLSEYQYPAVEKEHLNTLSTWENVQSVTGWAPTDQPNIIPWRELDAASAAMLSLSFKHRGPPA